MKPTLFLTFLALCFALGSSCNASSAEDEALLPELLSAATEQAAVIDTLQELIKLNLVSIDFALQPNIHENQSASSAPLVQDPLSHLLPEEQTQIQQSVSALITAWNLHLTKSDELLRELGRITDQMANIKSQLDRDQKIAGSTSENLTNLSNSIADLEAELRQLESATMTSQSNTLKLLSETPPLAKGATYLRSNSPRLQQ